MLQHYYTNGTYNKDGTTYRLLVAISSTPIEDKQASLMEYYNLNIKKLPINNKPLKDNS